MTQHITLALLMGALAALGSPAAHAATIVAPDGASSGASVVPFDDAAGMTIFQQAFTPATFSEPVFIEGIAFDIATPTTPADYSATIEILMGRTAMDPEALSMTLGDNPSTPLQSLRSGAYAATLQSGFSLSFAFGSSFEYDPATGESLLVQIVVSDQSLDSTGSVGVVFDATAGDGYGWARDSAGFGTSSSFRVLRTQLTFTPVPEPSTALLVATGLAAMGSRRRRRPGPPSGQLELSRSRASAKK